MLHSSRQLFVQLEDGVVELLMSDTLTKTEHRLFWYLFKLERWGDRFVALPSQAEIALQLGVRRETINQAQAKLQQLGLWEFKISKWSGRNLVGAKANTNCDTSHFPSHSSSKRVETNTQLENSHNPVAGSPVPTISHTVLENSHILFANNQVAVETESHTELEKFHSDGENSHSLLEINDGELEKSHSDIYKERACEQTKKTYIDLFQTETDSTATVWQTQSVLVELEETNRTIPALVASGDQTQTCQLHDLHEDKFCATADPEILRAIEAAIYNWRSRPWMETATTFKSEMVQAVWRCNPKWYSLEGSSTPNLKKICDRLRQLERQLKLLNADAVTAWQELQNYWRVATAMNNPDIQQQFHQVELVAKQQSLQSQLELRKQQTLAAIQGLF